MRTEIVRVALVGFLLTLGSCTGLAPVLAQPLTSTMDHP